MSICDDIFNVSYRGHSHIPISTHIRELHNLRFGDKHKTQGFVEVRNIKCIVGRYPEELIHLWKAYDDSKGSENDCPSMFDENQLYIVLELGHGGQDLEAFVFPSAAQAHALFVQVKIDLLFSDKKTT